ncbi:MAG: ATP-dependent helicase HrpB [Deltaproteobacteria bacterium]|nr:ATP-dependent helicase HrpB [Deltaproteobacteria bacterium]
MPATNERQKQAITQALSALAIAPALPELRQALGAGCAVLAAPPGSGKTTGAPLALLDEPWLAGRKILMLQPRRLAARGAAARMASLLGEQVGETVGFQIRFERRIDRATRIEVLTEGILTRRLQSDQELAEVGLVIFDEFHERSIHADLGLALCLDLRELREDLRLLVMSATLDTGPVAALLGNVPVITGHGRSFPVEIDYLDREPPGRVAAVTGQGIRRVLAEKKGDILAFLPGSGEIREVREQLEQGKDAGTVILPLFGNLSQQDQDRAILPDPGGRRRVVLATSIAETSLTIEGIENVVDSGWSRLPRFQPASGLSRLETVRVSRAAARQRTGRAGRLGPGYCLRLWTRHLHHGLAPFHPPEICAADLAPLALELALWGAHDAHQLRWLDPPPEASYETARQLLISLGAVDAAGRITPTGRQLAALPLHPRLAHMLIKAAEMGQLALACDVAALVSERDIRSRGGGESTADLQERLRLLALYRRAGAAALQREGGDAGGCRLVDTLSGQWRRMLTNNSQSGYDDDKTGLILAFAYPDRIAVRRPGQRERYQLAGGRGGYLPPNDPLSAFEYLAVAQLDAGQKEGRIFLAAAVDLAELRASQPALCRLREDVDWDPRQQRVMALRRQYLGKLVVSEQPLARPDAEQVVQAMLTGIKQMGLDCLPWSSQARQIQARLRCLREWQPEEQWPLLDDAHLLADLNWLAPYLTGITRREQLRQLDLAAIFRNMLDWRKQQELEHAAPERLQVPSGSRIRIDYHPGEAPVLAVRLQEMFGLEQTPTVCHGRVKIVLHLLSPAQRPIQVTSDLAGFWQRSYPEVKKELKGRYPKHSWPDDPLTALPTAKTKKRSSG